MTLALTTQLLVVVVVVCVYSHPHMLVVLIHATLALSSITVIVPYRLMFMNILCPLYLFSERGNHPPHPISLFIFFIRHHRILPHRISSTPCCMPLLCHCVAGSGIGTGAGTGTPPCHSYAPASICAMSVMFVCF